MSRFNHENGNGNPKTWPDRYNANLDLIEVAISGQDVLIEALSGQELALNASLTLVTADYNVLESVVASISADEVFTSLTSVAGSVDIDMLTATKYKLTLTENTLLNNPTNAVDGQELTVRIKQDGTGGWTLTFGDMFSMDDGYSTLSVTTSGTRYILNSIYDSGDSKFDAELIGS